MAAVFRFAHAALAAFTAAVEGRPAGADLTAALTAAADAGEEAALRVAQPPLCGLHRVDTAVQDAYGTFAGTRTRRRPLPKQMLSSRSVWKDWTDPPPLDLKVRRLEDLARVMASYVEGGALRRELHPPADRAGAPAASQ
ncbi:hypothetical protein O1L60_44930 [Streptomyces diastatochromogenes]|nr:hypothetical protein [Streptomyces diastatochromogenes]